MLLGLTICMKRLLKQFQYQFPRRNQTRWHRNNRQELSTRGHSRRIDPSLRAFKLEMSKSESIWQAWLLQLLSRLYPFFGTPGCLTTDHHYDVISRYGYPFLRCKFDISFLLQIAHLYSYQEPFARINKDSVECEEGEASAEDMEVFPVAGQVSMLVVPTRRAFLSADDHHWREKYQQTPF